MLFLFLQVNDAVLVGDSTLVSCSSDTTVKVCWWLALFVPINPCSSEMVPVLS